MLNLKSRDSHKKNIKPFIYNSEYYVKKSQFG